jgi:hypothetical protein
MDLPTHRLTITREDHMSRTDYNRCNGMLVACFIILYSSHAFGHSRLDSPNGGEVFRPGDIVTIEYGVGKAHPPIEHFELHYSTVSDSSGFQPIELSIIPPDPNALTGTLYEYEWTVPDISAPEVWVQAIMLAGAVSAGGPFSWNDVSELPFSIVSVPEPSAFVLFGGSAAVMLILRRRHR